MGIIDRLEKEKSNRDFVFTAIDTLKDEQEIIEFYNEYIEYLRQNGANSDIRESPEEVASENIGYILGYYDKKTEDKWWKILPDARHPIFGKLTTISPDDAFKAGQIAVKKGIKAAKEYIKNKYAC